MVSPFYVNKTKARAPDACETFEGAQTSVEDAHEIKNCSEKS